MSSNISNMSYFDNSESTLCTEDKELIELFKKIKAKAADCEKYNRFLDVVDESSKDNTLNKELKEKVRYIMRSNEVKPCMILKTKNTDQTLLGLEDKVVELTFDDKKIFRELVRSKLRRPKDDVLKYLESNENYDFSNLAVNDRILIDNKKKLANLQESYVTKLLTYQSLLRQLSELRLKQAKTIADTKVEESRLKSNTLQLRSEIIKQKTTIAVFDEIPLAYNSYTSVLKDIIQEQGECRTEIEKLTKLKEQYKQVSSKQYDHILEGYRQYKGALAKRKKLLEQMKKVDEIQNRV